MRNLFIIIVSTVTFGLKAQSGDTTTLSLLFMGDIMGHDTQIASALQPDGIYDYTEVFNYIHEEILEADIAIANLEVTLAGPPYKGYPQFSSPDALATALQNTGVDVLGTANNHSVDRGKAGILRTLNVLDTLKITHMGTYRDTTEKNKNTPLILEQNGFRLAFLNYTYGTNGISVPAPTVVNLTDKQQLAADIDSCKALNVDKIILFIHWGSEYQHEPNKYQADIAKFCLEKGVDYIIGSHPHVIQKSEWISDTTGSDKFITWSLGNFISNQRKQYTDGGQMIKLILQKTDSTVTIKESGYYLTWVYTPIIEGKRHFHVLPCAKYELQPEFFIAEDHFNKMKLFISDSRNLLNTQNTGVGEYLFYDNQWISP